ncbi:MAG: thioredoxin family protein [Planctomycetota bacterium]
MAFSAGPAWAAEGPWTTDFAAAVQEAESEGKDLLLDFTGSDWCGPCIQLDETVFQSDAFLAAAPESFVLVKLDFPSSKPQTPEVKAQNERLQGEYDVSGYPTIILADAQGRPYFRDVGYGGQEAEAYLTRLTEAAESRAERDAALAEAATLEGVAKAEALHTALSFVGDELALAFYMDEVEALIEAAKQGESDLDEQWTAKPLAAHARAQVEEDLRSARTPEDALEIVEAALEGPLLQGEARQELLMVKSNVLFSMGDKTAAKALLLEARALAPESENGQMVMQILETYFADEDESADHDHGDHEHGEEDHEHGEEDHDHGGHDHHDHEGHDHD